MTGRKSRRKKNGVRVKDGEGGRGGEKEEGRKEGKEGGREAGKEEEGEKEADR